MGVEEWMEVRNKGTVELSLEMSMEKKERWRNREWRKGMRTYRGAVKEERMQEMEK